MDRKWYVNCEWSGFWALEYSMQIIKERVLKYLLTEEESLSLSRIPGENSYPFKRKWSAVALLSTQHPEEAHCVSFRLFHERRRAYTIWSFSLGILSKPLKILRMLYLFLFTLEKRSVVDKNMKLVCTRTQTIYLNLEMNDQNVFFLSLKMEMSFSPLKNRENGNNIRDTSDT